MATANTHLLIVRGVPNPGEDIVAQWLYRYTLDELKAGLPVLPTEVMVRAQDFIFLAPTPSSLLFCVDFTPAEGVTLLTHGGRLMVRGGRLEPTHARYCAELAKLAKQSGGHTV